MKNILADLERTKNLLDLINRITNIFVDTFYDSGFNLVLDEITKFMQSDYGVLGYLSPKNQEYVVAEMTVNSLGMCEMTEEEKEKIIFKKHELKGVWIDLITDGNPVIKNNFNFEVPKGHLKIKNFIGIPIKKENKVIAYIALASSQKEYDKDDLEVLSWIGSWLCPVLLNRIKDKYIEDKMKKIQIAIMEMFSYANMYVLILDDTMTIKFINYSLATELGFSDEIQPLNRCWLDFVSEKELDVVKIIHHTLVNFSDEESEKYREVITECKKLNGDLFSIKWFNVRINHKYNWSFSFGLPCEKEVKLTEESVREYWNNRIVKDKVMIQTMRDLILKNKVDLLSTCEGSNLEK